MSSKSYKSLKPNLVDSLLRYDWLEFHFEDYEKAYSDKLSSQDKLTRQAYRAYLEKDSNLEFSKRL